MTNNKQQTAMDILCGKLAMKLGIPQAITFYIDHQEEIREAKEMEKKQHKKTWLDSTSQFDNAAEMTYKKDFDEHYNETYGGGEQ